MYRIGQHCIYAPYMAVYLVISLPKIPCIHYTYICMVLANPTYVSNSVRNSVSNNTYVRNSVSNSVSNSVPM
jgi:hypothetical protein